MTWVLWTLVAILVVFAVLVLSVYSRYKRFRRHMPQPQYRIPRAKPNLPAGTQDEVRVAWIGHSTLLIHIHGLTILTDPVFSEQVGVSIAGLWTIGPKRHTAPALRPEEVRGVDLILLSHAHMDHLDLPSLRRLQDRKTEVVTATGTSRLLRRLTFAKVKELGAKDSYVTRSGVKITAVPVRHWGNRFPWNKNYGWTGYRIEYKGVRIFFAGDTAYTPTLKELQRTGPIDIACFPIGAYAPDSFQTAHCTPEQAWQMFRECGAKWFVPIHWDTFVLSYEPVEEPLQRLLKAAGDETDRIVIRELGEEFMPQTQLKRFEL